MGTHVKRCIIVFCYLGFVAFIQWNYGFCPRNRGLGRLQVVMTIHVALSPLVEHFLVTWCNCVIIIMQSEIGAVLRSAWHYVQFEALFSGGSVHVFVAHLAASKVSIPCNGTCSGTHGVTSAFVLVVQLIHIVYVPLYEILAWSISLSFKFQFVLGFRYLF